MVQDPVEKALEFIKGLREKYQPFSLEAMYNGGLMSVSDKHSYEICLSLGIG